MNCVTKPALRRTQLRHARDVHAANGRTGRLLVAHPDRKAQRALARLVGATLHPVEVFAELDKLLEALTPESIAVVDAGLAQARPGIVDEYRALAWIAVPGEGGAACEQSTVSMLLEHGWDHVIAHPMPVLAEELLATVQKILRDDPFALEKYVAWGAEMRSYRLDDADERDAAVAALAKDVITAGSPDRVGSLASVIADELLANALFTAPVDERGARIRQHEPRDRPRRLQGRDIVTLRWATDARYLAIEVRDQWGSIDPVAVARRLARVNQESATTPDGGMGLPLAYACANQFIIGISPGRLTEMIALIDLRFRPTELSRVASFHVFSGEHPPGVES